MSGSNLTPIATDEGATQRRRAESDVLGGAGPGSYLFGPDQWISGFFSETPRGFWRGQIGPASTGNSVVGRQAAQSAG